MRSSGIRCVISLSVLIFPLVYHAMIFGTWVRALLLTYTVGAPEIVSGPATVQAMDSVDAWQYGRPATEVSMNSVVIEHVPVAELPEAWRARLAQPDGATVTVRIEEEAQKPSLAAAEFVTDDPAFGIWRDREDMPDAAARLCKLRAPRYNRDGSRNE
jgi:hypothetical protein